METPDPKNVPAVPREPVRPERPRYEPPRVVKKRSVSRTTLFTGGGPSSGGAPAVGPSPDSP